MSRPDSVLDRSRELTAVLLTLAERLEAEDAASVLDCESMMRQALTHFSAVAALDTGDRQPLRLEIVRARAALVRCRAVGAARLAIGKATLDALGRHGAYGPQGSMSAPPAARGVDLQARG